MSVIDYLNRLVNQIGQAINLALQIVTTLITSGWYVVVRDGAVVIQDVDHLLNDPTCGQEAQCTKLDTIISDLATILSGLAAPTWTGGGGTYVLLPSSPPAGYGGASADDVWTYVPPAQSYTTRSLLSIAGGIWPKLQAVGGWFPVGDWPFLAWGGPLDEPSLAAPNFNNVPYLDWTTIQSGDGSTLDWLNRQYPGIGWYDAGGGMVQVQSADADNVAQVTIDPGQFAILKLLAKNGNLGPTNLYVPPVFPGASNVTFGDTQSMDAPNGALSGPADGYQIVIDAFPSWAGTYDFGSVIAYRNVGAIAFVNDAGIAEPAQTLGLADVIYTPKTMTHSVGAYYRLNLGYHCAATPFTINS